jgi:NitT/TauT family transport system substrate-binding protein
MLKRLAAALILSTTALAVQAQGTPQTIRIAAVKATILGAALQLPKHLPAGWKTDVTYFTSPGDMTNALLTGSVDLAYIGVTIAAVARSKDQPIVVIANIAEKGTAIIVRNDSNIRTIQDLKGKKFGNLPLSIHDILLREELRKVGMKIDDLNAIRLSFPDMLGAMQRGEIEAFASAEPFATQAVMAGYGRLLMHPYDNPVGTINVAVLSTERVVKERADMLRVWIQAHAKATDEFAKNPDLWVDVTSKEWGFDRAANRRAIDNIQLNWRMDDRFVGMYTSYIQRLKELNVIQREPDLKQLVVRSFVEGVKP